jgi:hypothetical protein
MLGVRSETRDLPPNVKDLLKGFDDQVFANFTVCPLTRERPGRMQIVFVKSATNVVNRPRPNE